MSGGRGPTTEVSTPSCGRVIRLTLAPIAYRATQYLQDLLVNDAIVPEGSEALDAIFKDFSPSESSTSTEGPPNTKSNQDGYELLLRREAVPAIVNLFGMKKGADADIYRAIEQARLRVENEQSKT